jgi:predicted deacylase
MTARRADDYPIELTPPSLGRWADGSDGLPYVQSFEASRPGPHVLVTALVHGNEICGAIALDLLLREGIRPLRGRLSFVFANIAAYERFDAEAPSASRYVDEDFNRIWSPSRLDGADVNAELIRARELRPLIESTDLLLDLHSLQQGDAPLILCGPLDKGRALARRVGYPVIVIADAGHAAGTRMRDYGGFGDPASAKAALLVECGQHWARGTDRVAVETTIRFLVACGSIEAALAARFCADEQPPAQQIIEVTQAVTVHDPGFAFTADYRGLEVIAEAGTVIAREGGRTIATPYDDCLLIMPSLRLRPGQTAVRLGRRVA